MQSGRFFGAVLPKLGNNMDKNVNCFAYLSLPTHKHDKHCKMLNALRHESSSTVDILHAFSFSQCIAPDTNVWQNVLFI